VVRRTPGAPQARIDTVIDQHHCVAVADLYRYLEDLERPEVRRACRSPVRAASRCC
jgi:hypothetical protein